MASTEEVLKALQNAKITTLAATEPEELVIDAESRTITVPSSERLFGVTGDMNIERKYFRCPKIVGDNVDLSTHQIFIAYVYTETESGSIFPSIGVAPYHCEDMEVDGEDITFSWKLTGNVFKNPGFILFKMYAKKTETDPNTVFNTTPAIGTVLATIPDGTEEIVEEHPDVIAQIFDRLDALESGGGGGTGGTTNYNNLSNKPQLNGVTLEGNKTLDQVGVLAKNQGSSNSGKFLSVGSDGNVVPADAPSGGTVDPEQIKQAVNGYLEENPVSGMTAEQEQQLNQNTTDITNLKSAMSNKTLPIGGTTGQVLAKKSDADYDVEWTTIKNTGTVEPPSKEDTLLGALPYRITESNCYIISETEAQITTGEGPENLYIRNGEYLVGNPEGVEWGVDSLKYTPVDNLIGVYTHVGESNSFKPNTKYTLFADFESEVSLFIRVLAKSNDANPFLGDSIGQLNGSGYLTFTTSEDIKWLNLGFGFAAKGTGKFYNIAMYEGEYTERPKGGVFTLPANTKFNTDAYIGSTLSPVNEEVVSVYKVNTEDSENETNKDGVIFFGDSILDFSGVAEAYSKRTGKSVLDCAVGGTRLSGSRDSGNEYYPYDMTNIADSIASGDFSSQVDGGKNSNFSILNSGNLSAYKTIILEFGANDFTAKVPFNGEGVTTIEGSLKHILTTILTKYPTMRIVVFSTLHYVTAGKGEESGVPTHTDGTVWQMNEVIKSICESDDYCVPFIDMYHLFTENKLTRDILTSDGAHLSSSYGAPRYADIMTAQLNSIGV